MADRKLDYLLQHDVINELIPAVGTEQWQSLYACEESHPDLFMSFSCMLTQTGVTAALSHDSWDLQVGHGLPSFWKSGNGTTYHRYGEPDGVRPLVICRQFHGAFPEYFELCEEFRHYHNLAEDHTRGVLVTFDDSGYEIEVARTTSQKVEARLKYLKEFQAGTGLFLAVFLYSGRCSELTLGDVPKEELETVHVTEHLRYRRDITKCEFAPGYDTYSQLRAKVIIPPPPPDRAGVWPFEVNDRDKEVSFIIGADENGDPVEHTSHPDKLANYFGANPGAPHFLTPVYFRKEVLSKYYADHDRYKVSDGHLTCLNLWDCKIDNNHAKYVIVFLGYLGQLLPYRERLHWKQFNVMPGRGISRANYRRGILGQWADPDAPDLAFRQEYSRLAQAWKKSKGWSLYLPPEPSDAYLADTIRVPVTNSQAELDEQVLVLTKLLVDSLNEKEIAANSRDTLEGDKGIAKLERFLHQTGFPSADGIIQFLRNLQTLRSKGSGHRKGSEYMRTISELQIDLDRKPEAMVRLLSQATSILGSLGVHYCPGYRPVGSPESPVQESRNPGDTVNDSQGPRKSEG